MYCVELKTRNARLFKKSREVSRPITGRRRKPVHSESHATPLPSGRKQLPKSAPPSGINGLLPSGTSARTVQEAGDVLQLRDALPAVAAVLDEQRHDVGMLAARVRREELHQAVKDLAPVLSGR